MTTISNIGRIAYIYDQATETWHPVAGMTDASADFTWSGDHAFTTAGKVAFAGPVTAAAGINSFVSIADRTDKIPSPSNGAIAAVVVSGVLQLQYYYNGAWRLFTDNSYLEEKTTSFTISAVDAGKTLDVNSASAVIITVPLDSAVNLPIGTQMAFIQAGTGQVSFAAGSSGGTTVSLLSKNSNKKIASRYSQAILVKKATNTWYLMGDLTA
jgi:hypothetical protein